MFGIIPRKIESLAKVLAFAIIASTFAAPAAIAQYSAGNSFEVPRYQSPQHQSPQYQSPRARTRDHYSRSHAYYSPGPAVTGPIATPGVVQHSSTDPSCIGGYKEMDRSEAGPNGMGLLMKCH